MADLAAQLLHNITTEVHFYAEFRCFVNFSLIRHLRTAKNCLIGCCEVNADRLNIPL